MPILVLNSGSSSIKYRLFDDAGVRSLAYGRIERIGESGGKQVHSGGDGTVREWREDVADHARALRRLADTLAVESPDVARLAVGHRVVHGGARFWRATLIDRVVRQAIAELIPLAPLHNPAALAGIDACRALWPEAPQVAVFDTAFHHALPPEAALYALPRELAERYAIRRYGFHGISCAAAVRHAAEWFEKPLEALNLIVLHLGNGASATAVRGGRSIDTSMGLTPLAGLVMGTRCGDLDPGVIFYLARAAGLGLEEIEALLNRDSGLKGLTGVNDLREILARAEAGDECACEAVTLYCHRVRKYLGAYHAELGQVDGVIFTGGVGENAVAIRARACAGFERLGIVLDPARNASAASGLRAVHAPESAVALLVIPADEEREIARQTLDAPGVNPSFPACRFRSFSG